MTPQECTAARLCSKVGVGSVVPAVFSPTATLFRGWPIRKEYDRQIKSVFDKVVESEVKAS